ALRRRKLRQPFELWIQQTEQVVEGYIVAAMWCGSEQHHVALRIARQVAQQFVAQVASTTGISTGVSLVHDHQLGARAHEVVPSPLALYVVEGNDCERMHRKDGLVHRQSSLKSRGAACSNRGGLH